MVALPFAVFDVHEVAAEFGRNAMALVADKPGSGRCGAR